MTDPINNSPNSNSSTNNVTVPNGTGTTIPVHNTNPFSGNLTWTFYIPNITPPFHLSFSEEEMEVKQKKIITGCNCITCNVYNEYWSMEEGESYRCYKCRHNL